MFGLMGPTTSFRFRELELPLFVHRHNCGWPHRRMTERSVELAIADHWLSRVEGGIVEIGAVTPYYWPGRLSRVVDPTDPHACVTDQAAYQDVRLSGESVLSVSTFEHFGVGDYGLGADEAMVVQAFEKLFEESPRFLITMPTGYNPTSDRFALSSLPADVERTILCRSPRNNRWREVAVPTDRQLRYGFATRLRRTRWANGLVVLTRRWPGHPARLAAPQAA